MTTGQASVSELNSTVWATVGVSKLNGVGVIAIRDIPAGTQYTDYNTYDQGEWELHMLKEEEMLLVRPEVLKLILDKTIYPSTEMNFMFYNPNREASLQSFMNHSDDANTDGVRTLRDIKAGEELTENYRQFYPEGIHDLNVKNMYTFYKPEPHEPQHKLEGR